MYFIFLHCMTSETWKWFCEYYFQMWQIYVGGTSFYANTLNNNCFTCPMSYHIRAFISPRENTSHCHFVYSIWWAGAGRSQPGDTDCLCRTKDSKSSVRPKCCASGTCSKSVPDTCFYIQPPVFIDTCKVPHRYWSAENYGMDLGSKIYNVAPEETQ